MGQNLKQEFFAANGQPMAGHVLEASAQLADALLGIGDDPYAYGRIPTQEPIRVNGVGFGFEPRKN